MIEPRCANCVNWDSRDSLAGFCQEITDHLVNDRELLVLGLAVCRTAASGCCSRFDPSAEAIALARAETRHRRDLESAAGRDYPRSLGQGRAG